MVTIYDVAREAGVSAATVSRVINNSARVAESTKSRVIQTTRRLNYFPSAAARALASNTTETIAVVSPDAYEPFFLEVIKAAEREARRRGYHLLVHGLADQDSMADSMWSILSSVDGMIISCRCHESYFQVLQQRKMPYVLLSSRESGVEGDCIYPDNFGGGYQAVTHLIQHGYEKIAFIHGPKSSIESHLRFDGYRQALEDHNWLYDPKLSAQGDFSKTGGRRAMRALLGLDAPPRAVLTANDVTAIGAISVINEMGLEIPDDIAIVGFDNISMAAHIDPPLTTIERGTSLCGALAVRTLLDRIGNPDAEPQDIMMPVELVVRRSCGC